MKNIRKVIIVLVSCVSASLIVLGCGGNGASSNDQGVSVSFLGLFQSAPTQGGQTGGGTQGSNLTGCGQLPQPFASGYISIGQTFLSPTATPPPGFGGLSVDPSGAVYAIVGIQNNMFGQFFRADRVLLDYYIPGSSVQPPSTNVAVNLLAGPAEAATGGTGGGTGTSSSSQSSAATGTNLRRPIVTSLPPAFNQVCNRAFAQIPIIPAPIREWMNFNVNQLPEAPFDLEVVVSLTGLSSGGNRYDTNQGLFTISIVPEITVVPPTPAATAVATPATGSSSTSNATDTNTLSVREAEGEGGEAQGLDELEQAFETESVVDGE